MTSENTIPYSVKWLAGILSTLIAAAILGGFITLKELDKQQSLLERDLIHTKETSHEVIQELKTMNRNIEKKLSEDGNRLLQVEVGLINLEKQLTSGFSSVQGQLDEIKKAK